jgi:hypothetical protein
MPPSSTFWSFWIVTLQLLETATTPFFIDEAVGETRAFRSQCLRPPENERVLDRRNLGGRRCELNHFARLAVGCRHPILIGDDSTIVVLVVTDQDFAGGGNVLADNNRKAGLRR